MKSSLNVGGWASLYKHGVREIGKPMPTTKKKPNRKKITKLKNKIARKQKKMELKQKKDIEYANKVELAKEFAKGSGWPELKGTDNQIDYASLIRKEWIYDELINSQKMIDALGADLTVAFYEYLLQQTKASFWVDSKKNFKQLMKLYGHLFNEDLGFICALMELANKQRS